jgi:DMSO/TMAO reductase YedYZ molybdopterin-dependent catalytic subunit
LRALPKIFFIVVLSLAPIAWGQTPVQGPPTLRVDGAAGKPITLSTHDLAAMPRDRANVVDDKGNHAVYQGVPVIEILRRAGVPSGKDLRGKQMTLYLLVTASDGYRAVFALAEFDPDFTDRRILLAQRRDGKDLSAAEGPFRIVVPGEKRHARWVRNVTALRVERSE